MQIVSARIRQVCLILISLPVLLCAAGGVSAQSAAENIMPVGRVCLAGQACVGNTAGAAFGNAATATAPVASAPAPAAVEQAPVAPAPVAAAAAPAPAAFDAAAKYQLSCFACHSSGAAGAPVTGDADAWSERLDKGMDVVMTNVINGLNAMPAKGMCMDCSDDDLRALVDYMIEQ